jgi:hypothetical protein
MMGTANYNNLSWLTFITADEPSSVVVENDLIGQINNIVVQAQSRVGSEIRQGLSR